MKEAFTRKIGPLPTWAWTAIIGAAVVLYELYSRHKSSAASSTSSTVPDTTPPTINQFQITSPPVQEDEDDTDTDDTPVKGTPIKAKPIKGKPKPKPVHRKPPHRKTPVEHHSRRTPRPPANRAAGVPSVGGL